MKLTTELLTTFIGGQVEIQNHGERYIFRGEIKTVEVVGPDLRVGLKWFAKGEGYPPIPTKWVVDHCGEYAVDIELGSASNIGPSSGDVGGGDRICIHTHPAIGEILILYPPDGSKLDPAKVEGLVLLV